MDSEDAEALCAHIVAERLRRERADLAQALIVELGYVWSDYLGWRLPPPKPKSDASR